MITINVEKARALTADRLRLERIPKLEALDVEFQRALETNAPTTEIVAQKQTLRDLPAQVSGKTLEQLKELKV